MPLKDVARRIVPGSAYDGASTAKRAVAEYWERRTEFSRDAKRYWKYALARERANGSLSPVQLEAQLTRDYHRVEKGMTLRRPRRPFGRAVNARLQTLLSGAAPSGSLNPQVLASATSAVDGLARWNEDGVISDELAPRMNDTSTRNESGNEALGLFGSRRSVRDFRSDPPPLDIVRDAIAAASYSPSVCNRQPWKAYVYTGERVAELLAFQNGNAGFTNDIPMLIITTVELGYFSGPGERNQAWIEGGIFSSTLMWALHGTSIQSCMLNLSLTTRRSDALRAAAGIPQSEVLIMMLAVGYANEGVRVARSPRKNVASLISHEPPVRDAISA